MKQKTPSYSSGSACAYGAAVQAPVDGVVTIGCNGTFMNGFQVNVGDTSAVPNIIAWAGNDINNNTWGSSFSFPVKAGSWFKVSQWLGWDYEIETSLLGKLIMSNKKYIIAGILSDMCKGSPFMVHGDTYDSIEWMDKDVQMPDEQTLMAAVDAYVPPPPYVEQK